MTKKHVLDLYFLTARHLLIEIAAFIDRVERSEGEEDFRMEAFRKAIKELSSEKENKAAAVLTIFSDTTTELVEKSLSKSATGASNPSLRK